MTRNTFPSSTMVDKLLVVYAYKELHAYNLANLEGQATPKDPLTSFVHRLEPKSLFKTQLVLSLWFLNLVRASVAKGRKLILDRRVSSTFLIRKASSNSPIHIYECKNQTLDFKFVGVPMEFCSKVTQAAK